MTAGFCPFREGADGLGWQHVRRRNRDAAPLRAASMVCRPIRARRPRPITTDTYFPCLAMDTTDNDDSSDESLDDVISTMGSHSAVSTIEFDETHIPIEPPPSWDFMSNDVSWHALWCTTSQLKKQRICYSTADREVPFLAGTRALFRGNSFALACND